MRQKWQYINLHTCSILCQSHQSLPSLLANKLISQWGRVNRTLHHWRLGWNLSITKEVPATESQTSSSCCFAELPWGNKKATKWALQSVTSSLIHREQVITSLRSSRHGTTCPQVSISSHAILTLVWKRVFVSKTQTSQDHTRSRVRKANINPPSSESVLGVASACCALSPASCGCGGAYPSGSVLGRRR